MITLQAPGYASFPQNLIFENYWHRTYYSWDDFLVRIMEL